MRALIGRHKVLLDEGLQNQNSVEQLKKKGVMRGHGGTKLVPYRYLDNGFKDSLHAKGSL